MRETLYECGRRARPHELNGPASPDCSGYLTFITSWCPGQSSTPPASAGRPFSFFSGSRSAASSRIVALVLVVAQRGPAPRCLVGLPLALLADPAAAALILYLDRLEPECARCSAAIFGAGAGMSRPSPRCSGRAPQLGVMTTPAP